MGAKTGALATQLEGKVRDAARQLHDGHARSDKRLVRRAR